jgi:hypothetical protein
MKEKFGIIKKTEFGLELEKGVIIWAYEDNATV